MRTTQRKGDTAVAKTIAAFTERGWDVSIPLTESAAYDLIVDVDGELKRVQVKYCTGVGVDLRRIHSNAQGYVVKKPSAKDFDWLVVFDGSSLFLMRDRPTTQCYIKLDERWENLEAWTVGKVSPGLNPDAGKTDGSSILSASANLDLKTLIRGTCTITQESQ